MEHIISSWHFAPQRGKHPYSLISPWEINDKDAGKQNQSVVCVIKETCLLLLHFLQMACKSLWMIQHNSSSNGSRRDFPEGIILVWVLSKTQARFYDKLPLPANSYSTWLQRVQRDCFVSFYLARFCLCAIAVISENILGFVSMATADGASMDCGSVSRSEPWR